VKLLFLRPVVRFGGVILDDVSLMMQNHLNIERWSRVPQLLKSTIQYWQPNGDSSIFSEYYSWLLAGMHGQYAVPVPFFYPYSPKNRFTTEPSSCCRSCGFLLAEQNHYIQMKERIRITHINRGVAIESFERGCHPIETDLRPRRFK
jgi:hypothetical protein